jgi:hypothetical protein
MTLFNDLIAQIPYNPVQTTARGLLAPLMKATGHVLYLVGALAEPGYTLTEEEVQRELADASEHLTGTVAAVGAAPLSRIAKERINAFVLAVDAAENEYPSWSADDRGNNLSALAHRAASLAAFLDGELVGINNSDPGRTL